MYNGSSSARVAYEMATQLNRRSVDFVWWASIGITSLFLAHEIDEEEFKREFQYIEDQIKALELDEPNTDIDSSHFNGQLTIIDEYKVPLYRHSSLLSSFNSSDFFVSKFRMWTEDGRKTFQNFLLSMGMIF